MEQLYMDIIKFFTQFGWQIGVLAVSGIFLLGFFKMNGVFSKIKVYVKDKNGNKIVSKENTVLLKKFLYMFISVFLSLAACSVYLYIKEQVNILFIITIAIPVFAMNQAAYSVYENSGIRNVWKMFLNWIKKGFVKSLSKKNTPNEFAKQLDKLVNKFKDVDKAKVLTIINQSVNKKK